MKFNQISSTKDTRRGFEVTSLDGRVWVRPYEGSVEYTGETYETQAEALADIPTMAGFLGWSVSGYYITVDG